MTQPVAYREWRDKFHCYAFHGVDDLPAGANTDAIEPLYVGPIDMVLHCPECHEQHIDAPVLATRVITANVLGISTTDSPAWDNPPHRSHLCHDCGHIWRPCDIPTNGVKATLTQGKNDS